MDKRYQIFISSTFADLEDERKAIMEAIMSLDCFPAGMEMFPASDSQQFEYIKTIIDESDYYILVIAGRYGSEADDGISYTQKEFEYAREKGIPVLVFVKKDIDSIPVNKTDQDENKKNKLNKFREIAMKNRLAKYWDDYKDLKYEVHDSLSKIFKMNPRMGWIKGNIENNEKLLQQLNKSRQEYDRLMEEVINLKNQIGTESTLNCIASGEDKTQIAYMFYKEGKQKIEYLQLSWNEIFLALAKEIYENQYTTSEGIEKRILYNFIDDAIFKFTYDYEESISIIYDDLIKIEIQLQSLGLIKKQQSIFVLTEDGKKQLFNMMIETKK
jgi:hypothetical protein